MSKILVPIDFGKQSIMALEYAKLIATKTNSEIHLLTVVEESSFLKKLFDNEEEEKLINKANKALERLAEEYLTGLTKKTEVRKGKAYEQIEKYADEISPKMIIMGKTEEVSLAKRIIGSNTLHVIRETDYPVVSLRGESKDVEDIIMLPVDMAKPFTEQVNAAIEYAKFLGINKIFVLSVDISDDVVYETNLLVNLNNIKKTIEKAGLQCESEVVEGKKGEVVEIINKYNEELKPLLTIIMTRSESSTDELFVGSVAQKILETLKLPVMSIKPWDRFRGENPVIKIIYDPFNLLN